MKNFKKPSANKLGEGQGNVNSINVMNPDGQSRVLIDKDRCWVNPNCANFASTNKKVVKTIIQVNKENLQKIKKEQINEGNKNLIKILETKIPFKLEAFKDIPARVRDK